MDNLYNRVARRRRKGEGGFTLIELLVVIAILGVLAAIVVFNVTGVKHSGNVAACNADAQTLQAALDEYYNDHNDTYPFGAGTLSSSGLTALDAYVNNPPALPGACSAFTITSHSVPTVGGGTTTELTISGTPAA